MSAARRRDHAVGVAGAVHVEPDQDALVVHAVDGGGPDAVRVVHGAEPVPGPPGEAVHGGGAAAADGVRADDLIAVVGPVRVISRLRSKASTTSPSSLARPTSGVSRTGSCVLVSDILLPSRFVNRKRLTSRM